MKKVLHYVLLGCFQVLNYFLAFCLPHAAPFKHPVSKIVALIFGWLIWLILAAFFTLFGYIPFASIGWWVALPFLAGMHWFLWVVFYALICEFRDEEPLPRLYIGGCSTGDYRNYQNYD